MKLYRYDYSGGQSLGGCDYGPGTEWHVADAAGIFRYCKREGVDNKFWRKTGYDRNVSDYPDYKFICDIDEETLLSIDSIKISEEDVKLIIAEEDKKTEERRRFNTVSALEM